MKRPNTRNILLNVQIGRLYSQTASHLSRNSKTLGRLPDLMIGFPPQLRSRSKSTNLLLPPLAVTRKLLSAITKQKQTLLPARLASKAQISNMAKPVLPFRSRRLVTLHPKTPKSQVQGRQSRNLDFSRPFLSVGAARPLSRNLAIKEASPFGRNFKCSVNLMDFRTTSTDGKFLETISLYVDESTVRQFHAKAGAAPTL